MLRCALLTKQAEGWKVKGCRNNRSETVKSFEIVSVRGLVREVGIFRIGKPCSLCADSNHGIYLKLDLLQPAHLTCKIHLKIKIDKKNE